MILSYADINDQQKKKYMKRVKRAYEDGKVRERETRIYTVLPGFVCIYIDTSLNRTPFPTPSTTLACISISEMRTLTNNDTFFCPIGVRIREVPLYNIVQHSNVWNAPQLRCPHFLIHSVVLVHSHTDIDWHIQWCVYISLPSLYRRVYHLRMYRPSLN